MAKPIELWVRILVLVSLSIQIGLMFLAPLRKRSSNKVLMLTIWLFYLTAELVPPLALGNMGKKIDPAESGDSGTITGDLTILWASFLLLHLGDPSTITSYSTNNNELWWHLPLGLAVQVVDVVYAFCQSPQNPVLSIPTTLVCIAGMIKFVEKIHALRLGSRDNLKDKIMREIRLEGMIGVQITWIKSSWNTAPSLQQIDPDCLQNLCLHKMPNLRLCLDGYGDCVLDLSDQTQIAHPCHLPWALMSAGTRSSAITAATF